MDWISFVYGLLTAGVIALIFTATGIAHVGTINGAATSDDSGTIPEKCKTPAGQDVNSWKEHLGHHAETKECLKYYG